jgi:hypothetical protein
VALLRANSSGLDVRISKIVAFGNEISPPPLLPPVTSPLIADDTSEMILVTDSLMEKLPVGAGIGPLLLVLPLHASLVSELIVVEDAISPNHWVLLITGVGARGIGPPLPVHKMISPLAAPDETMTPTEVPNNEVMFDAQALIGLPLLV